MAETTHSLTLTLTLTHAHTLTSRSRTSSQLYLHAHTATLTCAMRAAHPLTITMCTRTRMRPHSQVLPVFSTSGWWCQLRAACQVWSGFECWVHTNHPQHWLRRRVWLPLWQRCRHCVGELGCGVCRAMHPAATPMKLCVALWPAMVSNDQRFANHSNSHALAAFVS